MANTEIGKRIKQRRNELEISVMDLAGVTGLSKATLHRYESGDIKNIKRPVIESIAHYLQVDPDWLMGITNEPIQRHMHKNENDISFILKHVLRTINDHTATNKGQNIKEKDLHIVELGVTLLIALLEHQYEENNKG